MRLFRREHEYAQREIDGDQRGRDRERQTIAAHCCKLPPMIGPTIDPAVLPISA